MKRLLALTAALGALSACNCINGNQVTGFKCGQGGACDDGFTCCADGYCRADCTGGSGGGSGTGGGGGNNAGGGTGGAGGLGGSGGSGGGTACTAGEPCTGNPTACKVGRTSCATGAATCIDAENATDGLGCGGTNVCIAGACVACMANAACGTNPNPCVVGVLTCSSSGATCTDGTMQRATGDSCGVDKVCNAAGQCIACAQNSPCTGNPTACKQGRPQCGTGAPVCADSDNKPAGASCGNGQVCDGQGACVTCTDGAACSTNPNPCMNGRLQCTNGAACVDGTPKSTGDSCGTDRVCSSTGQCVACAAGSTCNTNPTACREGITVCTSGAPVCTDGMNNAAPGKSCGTDQVCNSMGQCVSCVAGAMCGSNPGAPCKTGRISCATGAQTCADDVDATLGTACTGGFCASGACVRCDLGGACNMNPTPCKTGVFARNGAQCVCADDKDDGVGPTMGCSGNMTCDGMGACVSCGNACDPTNVCQTGTVNCMTLACQPTGNKLPGPTTGCAGTMTCNGSGNCVQCGQMCSPQAQCRVGQVSCTDPNMCADRGPVMDGLMCMGGICLGGACCSGAQCRNGQNQCVAGNLVTQCGSGGSQCRDCTFGPTFGQCQYAGQCDSTGDRTRTDGVCTATGCSTTTTLVTNDPACNRLVSCNGTCHGNICCPSGTCFDGNTCQPIGNSQTQSGHWCGPQGGGRCTEFCGGGPILGGCHCNQSTARCAPQSASCPTFRLP